ncbi:MAG: hypothetical protein AAF657_22055, partial [Acidobacteriota bacterium]
MTRLFQLLREPISAEKRALLAARWQELPSELRVGRQVVGQHHVHCGYTLGASYCAFGCTHCYLPANANRAPLPSLVEMREQIDANRRLIGPGGGLQITGGDVVDAYWRADRADELIDIVRYATDSGVVPMLMTHGQKLLEHPSYLDRLIVDGGLRKIAIHIDITQAGRPGYPIRDLTREADLHPLREQFVELILQARRRTGVRFHVAHTVTVTERNLASIGQILHWLLADPRHLDVFRLISLQPEADVGRTRQSANPVTPEQTWTEISAGVGRALSRDGLLLGHPDCSHSTTLLVLHPPRHRAADGATPRTLDLIADDDAGRAFWPQLLATFGGVGSRGERRLENNLRRLGLFLRHPTMLGKIVRYAFAVLRREGVGAGELLRTWFAGRLRGLCIVQHNFMSAAEVEQPRST